MFADSAYSEERYKTRKNPIVKEVVIKNRVELYQKGNPLIKMNKPPWQLLAVARGAVVVSVTG